MTSASLPQGRCRASGLFLRDGRIVVCALGLALAAQVATADVVVLRDQSRLTGTVVNRKAIARDADSVSIVIAASPSDGTRIVQIPVTEIEYVVLESASGWAIRDFSVPSPAERD